MKRLIPMLLAAAVSFLFLASPDASAQKLKVKKAAKTEVSKHTFGKENVLFVTGMIKDAETNQLLQKGSKIKFEGVDKDVVLYAQANDAGSYAIVLDKTKLRFPASLVMSIKGYENVVVDMPAPGDSYVNSNILLVQSNNGQAQNVSADMEAGQNGGFQSWGIGDTPFNTFIFR